MHASQKKGTFSVVLGLLGALIFASSLGIGAVFAHEVEPTSAQPEPGKAVAQAPQEAVLVFPEELAEQNARLAVVDNAGKIMAETTLIDLNDANHATLRLKLPALAQGVYQVQWKIQLSDGDATEGAYHFGVGNVTVPVDAPVSAQANDAAGTAATGVSTLPLVLGGVVLVLIVVIGVVVGLRRGRPGSV